METSLGPRSFQEETARLLPRKAATLCEPSGTVNLGSASRRACARDNRKRRLSMAFIDNLWFDAPRRRDAYFEDSRTVKFHFNRPETDAAIGVLKILVFDSCRDNPFKLSIAER